MPNTHCLIEIDSELRGPGLKAEAAISPGVGEKAGGKRKIGSRLSAGLHTAKEAYAQRIRPTQ